MATKKANAPKKKAAAVPGNESIFIGCCSNAVDLVFVNDSQFGAQVGQTTVNSTFIRVVHPTKKFQILGLLEATVNKGTKPWQIYIVPGDDPMPLTTQATRLPKAAKKK